MNQPMSEIHLRYGLLMADRRKHDEKIRNTLWEMFCSFLGVEAADVPRREANRVTVELDVVVGQSRKIIRQRGSIDDGDYDRSLSEILIRLITKGGNESAKRVWAAPHEWKTRNITLVEVKPLRD